MAMYTHDRRSEEEKAEGNFALGFLAASLLFPLGAVGAFVLGGPKTRRGALLGSAVAVLVVIVGVVLIFASASS